MNDNQENPTVNEGTADKEFTVGKSDSNQTVSEKSVKVETPER